MPIANPERKSALPIQPTVPIPTTILYAILKITQRVRGFWCSRAVVVEVAVEGHNTGSAKEPIIIIISEWVKWENEFQSRASAPKLNCWCAN